MVLRELSDCVWEENYFIIKTYARRIFVYVPYFCIYNKKHFVFLRGKLLRKPRPCC